MKQLDFKMILNDIKHDILIYFEWFMFAFFSNMSPGTPTCRIVPQISLGSSSDSSFVLLFCATGGWERISYHQR